MALDDIFKGRKNIIVSAMVIAAGLSAGFFGPDIVDSLSTPENNNTSQKINYETISEDHDFSNVEKIDVSTPRVNSRDSGWIYDLRMFGDWQLSGLGGKPPVDLLHNTDKSTFYLHTWTLTPSSPGDWFNSTLSQNVTLPSDAENLRAVMEGRNGAFTLYENSTDYPTCTVSEMVLKVEGENSSVSDNTFVSKNSTELSVNITEMQGENVTLTGGVRPDSTGCRNDAWVRVDSLRIEKSVNN